MTITFDNNIFDYGDVKITPEPPNLVLKIS
jgi:hypothetical protein